MSQVVTSSISSEEKNIGKVISFSALVLLLLVLIGSLSLVTAPSKPGSLFLLLPFLAMCGLMLVIGRHQQKKYDQLGATPLKLVPHQCRLGQSTKATISIGKKNFRRVNRLSLKCWRRHENSHSTGYDVVWETELTPVVRPSAGGTELELDILIPVDKKPTNRGGWGAKQYHWQLSFEYVEAMTAIQRTWKIPVSH